MCWPKLGQCALRVSSHKDLEIMNLHTKSWKEREMEKKSFSRPTHDHNFLTRHKQNKVSVCFRVGTIVEFHAFFSSQIILFFLIFSNESLLGPHIVWISRTHMFI